MKRIRPLSANRAKALMRSSNLPAHVVLDVCSMQNEMDPIEYFARAVETEREHGSVGRELGTDVIGDDDTLAAKIALAHLLGVEYGKSPAMWCPCPYYYVELWQLERYCRKPRRKQKVKRNVW